MKKLLVTIVAVLVSASALAQGTINFNTKFLTAADGSTYNAGVGGNTANATAQLFLIGSDGTPTPIEGSQTTFRTAANAPYVNAVLVTVPGVGVNQTATFAFGAWDNSSGSSYETATIKGLSGTFTSGPLGGTPATGLPVTPPDLSGVPVDANGLAFSLVPEPSTIALASLGALALFARRRK